MYQRQGGVEESLYTSTLQPGQEPYKATLTLPYIQTGMYIWRIVPPLGIQAKWEDGAVMNYAQSTVQPKTHNPTECNCISFLRTSTHYSSSKLCMLEFLFHFTCSFLTYNFYYLATNSLPPFLCLYTYIGCHFTSVVSVLLMKALSWIGLKHLGFQIYTTIEHILLLF